MPQHAPPPQLRPRLPQVLGTLGGLRPCAALRATLREGYSGADLRADLLAGAVVGVVALPLSMALAIASGVPPQHGLYTAIVAGLLIAVLGGSRVQVSGPTAAFVVILAPIAARFGLGGLLVATAMAGVMLVALALARAGRLIQLVPYPVTIGFTAGIAVVIGTLQVKDLLGLSVAAMPEHSIARVVALAAALPSARGADFAVGALTLALLLAWPRLRTRVPAPLVALGVAGVASWLLARHVPGFAVATIADRFQYEAGGALHRGIPQLPPLPVLPWSLPGPGGAPLELSLGLLRELFPAAFAIAMLGAIESLLSAVVADGMTGRQHDPDAELLAQGVGNLVAPFFGGIAATGAIARTATNVRSGARSPVAAVVHALVVLASVVALAPLLGHLPLAALAALLLLVAWNMSEARHVAHTLRVAPRSDAVVLVTCFALTVVFDMVIAVGVGIVLASLLFLRRMAEVSEVNLLQGEHPVLARALPRSVLCYEIAGPLFFGAAHRAMSALHRSHAEARVVVLDLRAVPVIDSTGMVNLQSTLQRLRASGLLVVLAGVRPQPAEVLARHGVAPRPGELVLCERIEDALDAALAHVGEATARPLPAPG